MNTYICTVLNGTNEQKLFEYTIKAEDRFEAQEKAQKLFIQDKNIYSKLVEYLDWWVTVVPYVDKKPSLYGFLITVNGVPRIVVSSREWLHDAIYTYFRDEWDSNEHEVFSSMQITFIKKDDGITDSNKGTFKCMNVTGTFEILSVSTC